VVRAGAFLAPTSFVVDKRSKLLRLAYTRPHRYRRYRVLTMGLTVAVLFAVPLLGLARVDLWGGAHLALLRPVDLAVGLVAVIAAIVAFYATTLLIHVFAGRIFCGFGCPVAQLSRFADAVDVYAGSGAPARRAWLELIAFALLLSLAVVSWWVAPGVFAAGDRGALLALGALALTAGYAVLHARWFRWGFCQKLCPIGLYYSVVQTASLIHVEFDPATACTDCDACTGICPVDLEPRRLAAATPSPGGLAFMDLPGGARCLHCGACIEICEHMMRKQPGPAAMGFRRPRRPQPADPADTAQV